MREIKSFKNENGAVLIVALVILLTMTMIGVTNMQSSSLQVKMASNTQTREYLFNAAEAALREAEDGFLPIGAMDPTEVSYYLQGCNEATDKTQCFDSSCAGALCFNGHFLKTDGDNYASCELESKKHAGDSSFKPTPPYWTQDEIWSRDASPKRHREVDMTRFDLPSARYISEFLCFVDKDANAQCKPGDDVDCHPLFRITVLAVSDDNESERVMLQSTVKVSME